MARFSEPADHPARRAAVVEVIGRLDPATARAAAAEATVALLRGDEIDVLADLARIVPTTVLWGMLDLSGPVAIDDVEAMVRVIGRGEPRNPGSCRALTGRSPVGARQIRPPAAARRPDLSCADRKMTVGARHVVVGTPRERRR